ncbi:DUF945 family protein [Duganella sp. FT50W]|uniref:DUF945 family protein n=1 Tax=Duganella lactea TaxID=2692173 RepID=A0A6L8MRS9_9BURK|nr:DUF945 family protein [Duganella lactea]MYM84757.1 DUF945 family protein [Duganella lactea]
MNKTLLAAAMAGALLAMPAVANPVKPRPPEPAGEFGPVLAQLVSELKALPDEPNFTRQLDNYAKFAFSPELRPRLKRLFGTERPFPLERVSGSAKGQVDYVGKMAAHSYKQANGTEFSWTEAVANFTTDRAGSAVTSTGSWPSLLVTAPGSSFSVVNMGFSGKQRRGADGVAYGDAVVKIGVVTARAMRAEGDSKEIVRLDGITLRSDVTRRGAMAEMASRTTVDAIVFGNEKIERTNVAFRLTNLPAKALADLDKGMRAQQNSHLSQAAQTKALTGLMTDFGKRAMAAGATLVIDDISASYRGNTASIKGSIGFQKLVEADFSNVALWAKKMVARFEVRVPVALVKDLARVFASKDGGAAAPDAEQLIGKAVSDGYAVLDKQVLRSTIEIRDSKLIVNGKEIDAAAHMKTFSRKVLPPAAQPPIAPERQPEPAAE